MVKYCALCGVKRSNEISLHVFPTKEALIEKWKRVCGYLETDCVKTLLICSSHFRPEDFIQYTRCSKYGQSPTIDVKKLKQNVVPSVNVPYNMENVSPNLFQQSGFAMDSEEENFYVERPRVENVGCGSVEKSTFSQLVYNEESSTSSVQSILSENEYLVLTPMPKVRSKISIPKVTTPQRRKIVLSHARYVQTHLRDKVIKLEKDKAHLIKRITLLQQLVTLLKKGIDQ